MPLPNTLPIQTSVGSTLRQAVLWIAYDLVPTSEDYEKINNYPETIADAAFIYDDIETVNLAQNLLLLALKEKRLKAKGCRANPINGIAYHNPYEPSPHKKVIIDFHDTWRNKIEIPKHCWEGANIDWQKNYIFFSDNIMINSDIDWDKAFLDNEFNELGIGKIQIDTTELMEAFPKEVEQTTKNNIKSKSNAGRKSKYKWDEVFEEVAKYIIQNPICPPSQKVLNGIMLEWYSETHGEMPAVSLIHDKLKPIFDEWKNNTKE